MRTHLVYQERGSRLGCVNDVGRQRRNQILGLKLGAYVAATACLTASVAKADVEQTLARYVGYTNIAEKTIDHWLNKEQEEKKSGFEGCDYGRYIVFTDGTYLRCAGYGYQYAYRPDVILLSNGSTLVMIVEDEAYDMQR